MRYTTYLNNMKCMEWELNATQGILFSLLYEAGAWAKEEIVENKTYYFVSRNVILKELPMFFEKADTVYRTLKILAEKGVIEYIKKNKMDLIRLTEKGKKWNEIEIEKNVEKNPGSEQNSEKIPSDSEKNPRKLGKKSEKEPKNSENFPTNKNTNIHNNTNNKITSYKNMCEKIKNKWIDIANEFKLSGTRLKISEKRERAIKTLLKEHTADEILQAMDKIQDSKFLQGENRNNWQITFDWFINKANLLKVMEGNYDDRISTSFNNRDYARKADDNKKNRPKVTAEGLRKYFGGNR